MMITGWFAKLPGSLQMLLTQVKRPMGMLQKLKEEARAIALATFYFANWIGFLVLLKTLILAEYRIEFHGLTAALVGALVLAKVVLVLDHVSLGAWIRNRPAWVEVVLRTFLYALNVFVVVLFEKAFEGRNLHGGFGPSLAAVFQEANIHHVWANTICLTGALLVYNVWSVIRRHLGGEGLRRMFLAPLPKSRE